MIARFLACTLVAFGFVVAAVTSGQTQNYEGPGLLYSGVFLQGSQTAFTVDGPEAASGTASGQGLGGGVLLGYDLRWNNLLAGIEADVSVEDGGAALAGRSYTLGYIATVRGRLGAFVHPNWLVYATGGVAAIGVEFQAGTPGEDTSTKVNESLIGWTAGAGIEFDLFHFTLFGEYLYSGFDSFRLTRQLPAPTPTGTPPVTLPPPPPEHYTIDADQHLFRLGVKFKMGHDYRPDELLK